MPPETVSAVSVVSVAPSLTPETHDSQGNLFVSLSCQCVSKEKTQEEERGSTDALTPLTPLTRVSPNDDRQTARPPTEWPPLPPDVHEAVVQALADALVLDYRRQLLSSPGGSHHSAPTPGKAA